MSIRKTVDVRKAVDKDIHIILIPIAPWVL